MSNDFLKTAFGQLSFTWKLFAYAQDGKLDRNAIDIPMTFDDGNVVYALPNQVIESDVALIQVCENLTSIAFGAAAIALDRAREASGHQQANPIYSEQEQFIALVYQIRNAFAHDIARRQWHLKNVRYRRKYEFDDGVFCELQIYRCIRLISDG